MAYRMGPGGIEPETIAGSQSEAPPAEASAEAPDEAQGEPLDEETRQCLDQLLFSRSISTPRLCDLVGGIERRLSRGEGVAPGSDKEHITPTLLPNDLHPYMCNQHVRPLEEKFTNVYDCEMDPEEFFKYDYSQPITYYPPDLPEGADAFGEPDESTAHSPRWNTTNEPTTTDPPNLPEDADPLGEPNESIAQNADSNTTNDQVQSAPAQVPPEVCIIPPSPTLGAQEETGNNEVNQEEPLSLTGPTALDISKRAAEFMLIRISRAQEECLRGEPGGASTWRCLLKIQEEILRTAIKDCTDDKNEKHHRRLDNSLRLGSMGLRGHASKKCRSAKKQDSPPKTPSKTGTSENGTSHDGSPEPGPSEQSPSMQSPSTPGKKQQKKKKNRKKKQNK